MRVLFVAPRNSPDFLASCLWDGLQEVCGEANVVDAVGCPWLHLGSDGCGSDVVRAVSCVRNGVVKDNEGLSSLCDLLVINACFNREHDWPWIVQFLELLTPTGKVAYVEGWDAAWQVHPPKIHVDAYFRKEIAPNVAYPMPPHYLTFAAPERWFLLDNGRRTCDVFFSGNPNTCLPAHPIRWPALGEVFRTRNTHRSIIATTGMGLDYFRYFAAMRQSKLCLCLPAADNADSFRTFEAIACGAVPIFVDYPLHHRDPWFPRDACITCTVSTLAEHIDEALSHDLAPRRAALRDHALKYHTTAARARQMLTALGMTP
jgi:hypothetical protein